MNLSYFFGRIRNSVFGGRLTELQVDGITQIIEYRDEVWPKMSDDELAYLLATVTHETAFRMAPVREMGGEKYLRTKKYYPWVGEGLVQVTWEQNARKFGAQKPGDLMTWPIALKAAFEGMIYGLFTRYKLSDFIKPGQKPDYVGARRIINGTDRAKLISHYAEAYREAFKQANEKTLVA